MAGAYSYRRVLDECPRCGERNFARADMCVPCDVGLVYPQWFAGLSTGIARDAVRAGERERWLREYGEACR